MKALSFIGMLASLGLLIMLTILYFSLRAFFGEKETILMIISMAVTLFFFAASFIVAVRFKWGDKNSYTPMF